MSTPKCNGWRQYPDQQCVAVLQSGHNDIYRRIYFCETHKGWITYFADRVVVTYQDGITEEIDARYIKK